MGLLSLETGHWDLAVEWIANAIRQSPQARYLSSLGTALQRQGRREEALKAFGKAVQLTPDDAVLWTSLGIVLDELQCPTDAVLCFRRACGSTRVNWKRRAGALPCSTSGGEARKRSLASPSAPSHSVLERSVERFAAQGSICFKAASSRLDDSSRRALASHFGLLELGGDNCPLES